MVDAVNPAVAEQLGMRMTADELAKAIGVDTASISNWRRRHRGFPVGQPGDVRTYLVGELLTWLDTREVPKRQHRASDGPRGTYGARLRRYLSAMASEVVLRDVDHMSPAAMSELNALWDRYFRPNRVTRSDLLDAALLLTFTWITAPDEWEVIESAKGRLDTIAIKIDQVLRRFGFDTTADAVLKPLSSSNSDSVKRLVRHCGCLGVEGFEAILTTFAEDFGRTPETYRTPPEVSALMGACAVSAVAPLRSVADLCSRHGELVLAVPTAHGQKPPVLYAAGNDPVAVWRTRMHLIVRGRIGTAEVAQGGAPWRRHGTEVYDAVVVNPPFNGALGAVAKQVRWKYGSPPSHNSNLAWVQAALAATSTHGRAVVLMPISEAGSRIQDKAEDPRRELVDSGALRAVVRLSGDLFPATSVDTTVWVLGHPSTDRGDRAIVFVDATQCKHKESQRIRPRLVGVSAIADVIRTPGNLAPGEIRELTVKHGSSRAVAQAVAVPASEVAARGYLLTPHTYLGPVLERGEAHLQRIQRDADAVADARMRAIGLTLRSTTVVRRELDSTGLPPGWTAVRLGDLCDIKVGPSSLKKSDITAAADGVVPVLRPRNLHPRRIDAEGMDRTTRVVAERFATWKVDVDDLLLVRVGQVQNAAIVGPEHHGWLIDSNLTRLRAKPDTIAPQFLPRFLLEFLLRGTSVDQIRATATVNVAPSMSGSKLADFVITLPPLAEQIAILDILAEHERRVTALREAVLAEERLRGSLAEGLTTGSVELADRVL
ncbi:MULTISPECIES: type I restriction-modification system subunit M/S [unclassified Nocardia]|uniref:N-6 DNA methylase n=1 Tax=unclassified Nocardia TaxID=2637762 RepID=UPI001CE48AC5|nr:MULTISPECIES: type I restriction-modification system subunit M/S [unclassified Nocardia]